MGDKKQTEPKQRTKKGLEIPVPERRDFFAGLEKAAKTPKREESGTGKRRTSRDDR